jgi:DNA-binding NtrC family response regulator
MTGSILVVDDDPATRELLGTCLEVEDCRVVTVGSGEDAVSRLKAEAFDVVIADIVMPGMDGLEVLKQARIVAPRVPVILITAYATVETAVEALRRGAADYLSKPFRIADLLARVERFLPGAGAGRPPDRAASQEPATPGSLVGRSPAIQALRAQIARVAPTSSDVLITGETGTGKELVVRALHAQSPRRDQPMVAINCGAIPEGLFESALFGHARGAFTSAVHAHAGLVRLADRSTLFLDEVGEIPLSLQVKLLRMVEEKEIWAVGRTAPIRVDCRIIACTNRDLRRDVEAGRFREDLYYRLNVVHIVVAPLRDRRDDIPLLAEHFIQRLNAKLGGAFRGVTPEALEALVNHEWPGNVRELLHVVESAMISSRREDLIALDDLPVELRAPESAASLKEATRQFERQHILDVLARAEFDKKEAARRLGVSLASLYRKLEDRAD